MLISIHAATRGLISNNLPLGIATDGLIHISVSAYYGGAEVGSGEKELIKKLDSRAIILKDDEEILEMIATILPYL